jgi:hypothetical protein
LTYLKGLGEYKALEDIFDYWMSESGAVWEQEIGEMTEIADKFIFKAYELGWEEKAEKAEDILKHKSIGYVGRKEYSLYIPLKWFERIEMINKKIWKSLGVQLLDISKHASKLGDNRAAVSIDSTIAMSAGREGCQSLWEFANLTNKWNKQWLQTIFDGVISALENNHFSAEELIAIWELASKIFFVHDKKDRYDTDNNLRTIYITDIKEGIILTAKRLGYFNIEYKLKEIAEYEFSLKRVDKETHGYIIPIRWFDSNISNKAIQTFIDDIKEMTCEEAKKYVFKQFANKKSSFLWDFVSCLIEKYKYEKTEEIEECATEMYGLLMQRKDVYSWEWDGTNRAFEAIFPYLEKEKIKSILNKLVVDYFDYNRNKDEVNLFNINSDLEHFSYCYYKTLPTEDNIDALNVILEMHSSWLTGNGVLPRKNYYINNEALNMPLNWSDFCNKIKQKLYFLQ